jgi:hypothetical protein
MMLQRTDSKQLPYLPLRSFCLGITLLLAVTTHAQVPAPAVLREQAKVLLGTVAELADFLASLTGNVPVNFNAPAGIPFEMPAGITGSTQP